MRVSQFNGVKNQFLVESEKGELYQSYNSAIALRDNDGVVHLSEHWDYSKTTSKYRNLFLGETTVETKQKVASGEYKLDLELNGTVGG